VLLVLLRMAIGWQFLYEGLWKYNTLDTPTPWSAEGYLRNAQGPLRDTFRNMTSDPDDLSWLNYESVSDRWDRWHEQFVAHYQLDEQQQRELEKVIDGPEEHVEPLSALPEGVGLSNPQTSTDRRLATLVRYDPQRQLLVVKGDTTLLPAEVDELLACVPVTREPGGEIQGGTEIDREYYRAVERLGVRSQRLSFRQQLRALLKGDPERVGVIAVQRDDTLIYEPEMGTRTSDDGSTELLKYGEIHRYKDMLRDYQARLAEAQTDYQREHLEQLWQLIQQKRAELVQPLIGLEQQLHTAALELLKPAQLARGGLDWEDKPVHHINRITIWSLIVLGGLLLAGLLTPFAAVAGAGLLMLFYLAMPPFPGVPQPPGPEHSLLVNKNLIEAVALLAIAAAPTGRWFGLDALICRFFGSDFD
jgi:uncharacterized membrane protein YphA (DoxX/SURF4 family)